MSAAGYAEVDESRRLFLYFAILLRNGEFLREIHTYYQSTFANLLYK